MTKAAWGKEERHGGKKRPLRRQRRRIEGEQIIKRAKKLGTNAGDAFAAPPRMLEVVAHGAQGTQAEPAVALVAVRAHFVPRAHDGLSDVRIAFHLFANEQRTPATRGSVTLSKTISRPFSLARAIAPAANPFQSSPCFPKLTPLRVELYSMSSFFPENG